MTFLKFFKTLGSAVTFNNFKNFPCFRGIFGPSTVQQTFSTDSGVHQNVCCLSSAVTYPSNKTLIFHDLPRPTIKFHDFPGFP